jgi:uncharacterized membrane protein (UPF0136 family)
MTQIGLIYEIAIMYVVYAILLIVGGLTGLKKAKSKVSMISGVSSGCIALLAALITHWHVMIALVIGFLLAASLAVVFYMRYAKTQKPMPAVPMLVFSALVGLGSLVFMILRRV